MHIPGSGTLTPVPVWDNLPLVGEPVTASLLALRSVVPDLAEQVVVAEVPEDVADTDTLTAEYGMDLELSVNCILVAGRRAGELRIAACVVRATTRADVNRVVKSLLDVRKASFLPMDEAVAASGMEYGGITPLGLPPEWRLLVDSRATAGWACIGSGLRRSKLFVPGQLLTALPGAEVIEDLALPIG